jgi:hypothetical protein
MDEATIEQKERYYNVRFQTNRIIGFVLYILAVFMIGGSTTIAGISFIFGGFVMLQTAYYVGRRNRARDAMESTED